MIQGHIGPHANMERLEINEPDKKVGLYENPDQMLKLNDSDCEEVITFNDTTKDKIFPVEIMRLDKDGMVYKGKRIEDAGEAYYIFLEVMKLMKQNLDNKSLNLT